jgi:methyl-accepting chemotaxis protein
MGKVNMKVGTRLSVGFGLVLSMSVIIIAIAIIRFSSIGEINDKIIEKDWVKADATNTINTLTRDNARRTMELLIVTDQAQLPKIRERIQANKTKISEALDTLEKLIYKPEGKELLARIKEARVNYVSSFSKVSKLLDEGKKDEAISLMTTETLPALDALQEPISAMTDLQKKIVVASSAEVKNDIHYARFLMFILGGLALLAGIGAAFVITRSLLKQLGGEPDYAADIAGRIATGDLTVVIDTKQNDQTSLLVAMKAMRDSIVNIVSEVRVGTDAIVTVSGQIASGNLDLSSRTEEQASALQETTSSMEELTSTVKQNADSARQANQLAHSASEVAIKGGSVVAQVIDTMGSINESSKKIVDIIGVIDGIAFQTNILALNAAVEAARAGEQGRGFAVVATEVRNLAQRSAAAAKEIKALIGDSVEKVNAGARLVDQAGATMDEVVASVKRVTDIISEITTAGNEQTSGIEQINQAIMQMDEVTQQNAALVEEASSAAQSMQEQSENLSRVVSTFKLVEGVAPIRQPINKTVRSVSSSRANTLTVGASRKASSTRKLEVANAAPQKVSRLTDKTDDWEEF